MESQSDTSLPAALRAAFDYVAMGWPVIPGAVWHHGRFADPVDGGPVAHPFLRPVREATTDIGLVKEWWSGAGPHTPNVFTVTGPSLGAFAVFDTLAEAIAGHPRFEAGPTPVLAVPAMPLAYFLVRPPAPSVLLTDDARVLDPGTILPLPPSALGEVAVKWLVSPEEAGGALIPGDELAELALGLEGKSA